MSVKSECTATGMLVTALVGVLFFRSGITFQCNCDILLDAVCHDLESICFGTVFGFVLIVENAVSADVGLQDTLYGLNKRVAFRRPDLRFDGCRQFLILCTGCFQCGGGSCGVFPSCFDGNFYFKIFDAGYISAVILFTVSAPLARLASPTVSLLVTFSAFMRVAYFPAIVAPVGMVIS